MFTDIIGDFKGGLVYFVSDNFFNIESCVLENISSIEGGAIYLDYGNNYLEFLEIRFNRIRSYTCSFFIEEDNSLIISDSNFSSFEKIKDEEITVRNFEYQTKNNLMF